MAISESQRKAIEESRVFGKEVSKQNSVSLAHTYREIELSWQVRITVPFSYVASKNAIYGRTASGKKYVKQQAKKYRENIALLIKSALSGRKVKTNKVWIDIYVEKGNHRGDAVNVVDLVCDAIKLAIPVDDRWYSIRRLDWSINKHDPYLHIAIGQEHDEDSKCCELCGQIKPLFQFTEEKSSNDGKAGSCRSCRMRISDEELEKYPNRRTWR